MEELNFLTEKRYQLQDITDEIERVIKKSEIKEGLVLLFTPHSTAGILLTENEEGLKQDWLAFFKKLVSEFDFQHNKIDNNADSHILSGLIGQSKVLPLQNGKLVLGTWQQVFLAEFDGSKSRKVIVEIIGRNK